MINSLIILQGNRSTKETGESHFLHVKTPERSFEALILKRISRPLHSGTMNTNVLSPAETFADKNPTGSRLTRMLEELNKELAVGKEHRPAAKGEHS